MIRGEQESLAAGRDYEAARLNYRMMRARRAKAWANKDISEYVKLTLADLLVGFGHRLGNVLLWLAVIIILFSLVYCVFYEAVAGQIPPAPRYRGIAWHSAMLSSLVLGTLGTASSRFLGGNIDIAIFA